MFVCPVSLDVSDFLGFLIRSGYIADYYIFLNFSKKNNKLVKLKYYKIFLKYKGKECLINDIQLIRSIGGFNKFLTVNPAKFPNKLAFFIFYCHRFSVYSENLLVHTTRGIFNLSDCYKYNLGGKLFMLIKN